MESTEFPRVVIDRAKSVTLQEYLVERFRSWHPRQPEVVARTKYSITLDWRQREPFGFLENQLLYRVEKNDKTPPWIVVYRGGQTAKEIDNLAPRHPHKFRLKVILRATAVPSLSERAIQFYGDEKAVYDKMAAIDDEKDKKDEQECINGNDKKDELNAEKELKTNRVTDETGDAKVQTIQYKPRSSASQSKVPDHPWLESQWSDETWTNTDTDGTSIVCFCMAVRCGYIKQVQGMLDERPDLINTINPTNGFTPLATAVRKGDLNTVRFLLCAGAELEQRSSAGQTALHLAVLLRHLHIADLLLERGADLQARDLNGLRVEHYAVDSCDLATLQHVLGRGGDVHVQDNNGWTPLFRALCQGAKTEVIEELVTRGSDLNAKDRAGLPLTSVARMLRNRHGRHRDSVLRLVDTHYPHEKAVANFTRLTKKIYNVHSLMKLPGLSAKQDLRN